MGALLRLQTDRLPQKRWEETVCVWAACAALAVIDAPVVSMLCEYITPRR